MSRKTSILDKPRLPPRAARSPAPWLIAPVIFVFSVLPFLPALQNALVEFDDPNIILQYDNYRGLAANNLRWMFTTTHMGHYQPLTWVSYAIDYTLAGSPRAPEASGLARADDAAAGPFGRAVFMFHLTSILLHGLNGVLLLFVARKFIAAALDRSLVPASAPLELGAAAAALLFSMHPLRVESVAWVTERRDVLSTLFLLLSTLAYLRAFPPQSTTAASKGWYAASVALLLLSLLSKAWGMTFFVLLMIADWYPLRRLPISPRQWLGPAARRVLVQKIPFAALGVSAAAMASYAQGTAPYTKLGWDLWGPDARLCQAAYGLMFYVQKMAWPEPLCALYEVPVGQSLIQPRFIAGLLFVAVAAALLLTLWRRLPALAAAAAAYAITISPVLGFNQAGPQLVADRYSYIADMPWALLVGGLVSWYAGRSASTKTLGVLACATLAVSSTLGALAWRQTGYWRSTETLFAHCLESGQDGPIIRCDYGLQLARRNNPQGALEQYRRAIELQPSHGDYWYRCANALSDLGRYQEAAECYTRAAQLLPDAWRADTALGLMYMKLDRTRDAAERFRAAAAEVQSPSNQVFSPRPYLLLGTALGILGDDRGAREWLQRAAQYPETRDEALSHLRDLDADAQPR